MLLRVVKKWLKERLGIIVDVIPEHFLQRARDGTLMAQILHSYLVIDEDDLLQIEETTDPSIAYENFSRYIKDWLARLDIDLAEDEIFEITHGEGTAAITIFYQLYLILVDAPSRKSMGSLAQSRSRQIKRTFTVSKVREKAAENVVFEANPLCEPLIKQWDLINWERDRLSALMNKYMKSREEYDTYLEDKKMKELELQSVLPHQDETVTLRPETHQCTYDDLLLQQQRALQSPGFQPNPKDAKRFIKQIKNKHREQAERNAIKLQMQQQALQQIWDKIKHDEEKQYDKIVAEKLLQQSIFEKKMAEKLFTIRQQKDVMVQNRQLADEAEAKRREEEFVRRLFEEELEEQLKYHQERQILIEEHRQLYEEKIKRKQLKHEQLCRDIVNDLVDIALATVEYKKMYRMEPNKNVQRNWATLFIKQAQILEPIPQEEVVGESWEDPPRSEDYLCLKEMRRQDVLDVQDLEDYLRYQNDWTIEQEENLPLKLGMNVLGYVVHKLLLKKYPLPIPEKPNLSAEIEVAVCTSNLEDLSKLGYLQRLLALKSIKVIQMEDARNFCINAYEVERKTEFDDPFPDDVDLKEITPRKKDDKKKGGKKGKKEKGSKKSKDKGSKGSKKGKKGKKDEPPPPPPLLEEKQAQTPRLFPWERVILTNKARLGKIAKAELELGNELDDKLQVEMFVEYLLSLTDIKGWVLINYPNNFAQAALLEQALTGKPIPNEYYDEVINKESLESMQVEVVEKTATVTSTSISTDIEVSSEKREEEVCKSEDVVEATDATQPRRKSFKMLVDDDITPPSISSVEQFTVVRVLEDDSESDESYAVEVEESSKERMMRLLPDLIELAYTSDLDDYLKPEQKETKYVVDELKQEACTCSCLDKKPDGGSDVKTECTCYMMYAQTEEETDGDVFLPPSQKSLGLIETKDETTHFAENVELTKAADVEVQQDGGVVAVEELANINEDDKPKELVVAEDKFEDKRLSKIVPNPRPFEKEAYATVLTGFIRAIAKVVDEEKNEEPLPFFKELEKLDGLEKFYCDQGCYYLLQHEEINSDTIKCLAKMIIGDYSLPLKSSLEIFGERYMEAKFEVGDNIITKKGKKQEKKSKGKKGKKDKGKKSEVKVKGKKDKGKSDKKSKSSKKSDKKGKKGKKGKKEKSAINLAIEYEDKEVQFPMDEEEEELAPEPRAGEADWEYVDLPVPNDVLQAIATIWDNAEEVYVKSFKDVFYIKRLLLYQIAPYLAHVKQIMMEVIAQPDNKPFYLRQFQKAFNEINLDLRNDPTTKDELLGHIDQFREKLLEITDVKMRDTEEQRRNFIGQNWLYKQICEFVNNSAVAFQLEMDRYIDTLQFLTDYYTSLITKTQQHQHKFAKEILEKHDCDEDCEEFNELISNAEMVIIKTEFHKYIEECFRIGEKFVEIMKPEGLKAVKEARKLFEVKPKEKPKKGKKKNQVTVFEPDEDVKENNDRIFEEWECALHGEVARVHLHLNQIKVEMIGKLEDTINWIKMIFNEIYEGISQRHKNEVISVNMACDILEKAVQEEKIIQPELTFEGDQLAAIKIALFTTEDPVEDFTDGSFKIEQLDFMVDLLLDLAGGGYLMEKIFLLLLQDMTFEDEEVGEEERITPKLWRNLSTKALEKLFSRIFDDNEYVPWKDFIVCNLMVPFPTSDELMNIRMQFRELDPYLSEKVPLKNVQEIHFWFEEKENVELIKSIILKMYRCGKDDFAYALMLLDFCKAADPIVGFARALELSLGKLVCYDEAVGKEFVDEVLEQRRIYDEKMELMDQVHQEVVEEAKRTVSLVVDAILHECESATITQPPSTVIKKPSSVFKVESGASGDWNREGCLMQDDIFTESQIGFEARRNTQLAYFLPWELVEVVLRAALPWSSKTAEPDELTFLEKMENVYENCRNVKFNNAVLTHEFLNCEEFRNLLKMTNKFSASNPVKVIKEIIEHHVDDVVDEE